jgi:hypothetical protein
MSTRQQLYTQSKTVDDLADTHFFWIKLLTALRQVMIQSENDAQAQLEQETHGTKVDVGVWVAEFGPQFVGGSPWAAEAQQKYDPRSDPRSRTRGGDLRDPRTRGRISTDAGGSGAPTAPTAPASGQEIADLNLTLKGVDRKEIWPSANSDLAYIVKNCLNQSTNYFTNAVLSGDLEEGMESNIITFRMTVHLKHSIKL